MKPHKPYMAWPGWEHLRWSALPMAASTLWFMLVYAGCDGITSHRALRFRVDFSWEQGIPFVPVATVGYMSIYFMFLLAPFILRDRRQIRAACVAMMLTTAVAGVCFLLFPADLAYPPVPSAGVWQGLFDLADKINLDHNLAPSLHVAFSCLTAFMLSRGASWGAKVVLGGWALVVSLSAVLTHQHHVIDVVTGLALAVVVYAVVYTRSFRRTDYAQLAA